MNEREKRIQELERSVIALQLLNDTLTEDVGELQKALSAQTHRANESALEASKLKDYIALNSL